ncbi:flagellar hook-basal body complex protein FliE [Rhizobium sp. HT1-10]|uniref:flagellar hook-basal body complex protein FliE n=1 Tax=Rhizobium sp. HT1-10 TaxID=3111638 RepID=UPI003C24B88D
MIDAIKSLSSLSMTRDLNSISEDTSSSLTGGLTPPAATPGTDTGMSFASVMSNMAKDTVSTLKGAEAASFAGIKGTMGTREVVDAVMQANQTLQTTIAVRDKIVSAFLDITRMQI